MRAIGSSDIQTPREVLPDSFVGNAPRRRILEVALHLFATRGFHGTSVRDLSTALELQPSALYAHFPSKDHVLAALLQVGHQLHHDGLQEAVRAAAPDPVRQLSELVRRHAVLHARHPNLARVVNDELRMLTPELAAPVLALRDRSAAILLDVMARGIEARTFRVSHPMAAAAAIAAMGVRIPHWSRASSPEEIDALASAHVELALRMLGVP